ncbi:MAG: hypothetical protein ACTSQO_00620 [Candidatus Helarchaeota archaeon]
MLLPNCQPQTFLIFHVLSVTLLISFELTHSLELSRNWAPKLVENLWNSKVFTLSASHVSRFFKSNETR